MQIDIDPLSEVPLYQQLRDRIVEAIAEGSIAPGDALASVRQVAVSFGINLATVAKGYELLRREGLIRTNRRSGSVIARGPGTGEPAPEFVSEWQSRARTLLAEAVAQGIPDAEIVSRVRAILTDFGRPSDITASTQGKIS